MVTSEFPARRLLGRIVRFLPAVACSLMLADAGCFAEPAAQTLRIAYPHGLVTLDPHAHADTVTGTVLSAVYEGLVAFEPGLPVRPRLADRWTNPDDYTWRLHVRDGVHFHDGRPLTAADVVAAITRARSNAVAGPQLSDITSVREVEDDEGIVEIVTERPEPLLLTRLEAVAIVPADLDPLVPVGTGPYRWVSGAVQGPVVLGPWQGYWGEPADFDEIEIEFVPIEEEVTDRLARGALDVVASVSHSYARTQGATSGWRVEESGAVAATYLGLNLSVPPLDDLRVREAIDLAIDREALVASVHPVATAQPARSIVPAPVFGHSPEHRLDPADPERARALLAEAVGRGTYRLRIDCAARHGEIAAQVAARLTAIGMAVEVNAEPYELYYRRLEAGDTELFLVNWSFRVADASQFLEAFAHSRDPARSLGSFNGAALADHRLDELIDRAAHEPLSGARLDGLQQALSRLQELRAYLPIFEPHSLSLVREGFVLVGPALTMPRPQDVRASR